MKPGEPHFCPIPVADRTFREIEPESVPAASATLAPEAAAGLRDALLGGETHYTPRPGIPELREAVLARLEAAGAPGGGEVVITAGRREALFIAAAVIRETPATPDAGDTDSTAAGGDRTINLQDLESGLRTLRPGDLSGPNSPDIACGSLDGWPELSSFRVGFLWALPPLAARLRSIKQAVSICTAAPSQRAAALVLGPAPASGTGSPAASSPARPAPARKTGGDESRYSLMELAARLDDVVSLGRGDPDADAPAAAIEAACAALGDAEPLELRGQRRLRERIAEREARRAGVEWDPDTEVLVVGGAQEGIAVAVLALVGPGEDVILGDPRYGSYDVAVRLADGHLRLVPCGGGGDFGLVAADVEKVVRAAPKPRLLVSVNFQNPTGARTSDAEVEALSRIVERGHLWLLSDEVYADMALDGGGPPLSPASLPGMRRRTLTLGSVSKTWAMTGFRLGWLTGPPDAISACAAIKSAMSGPTSLFSQRAAEAALAGGDAFPASLRKMYAPRRKMLIEGLREAGLEPAPHGGGFFVWADVSGFGMPAEDFCRRLLIENRVLIFPGSAFGERWTDRARVSMLAPEARIREGLDRLRRFTAGLSRA